MKFGPPKGRPNKEALEFCYKLIGHIFQIGNADSVESGYGRLGHAHFGFFNYSARVREIRRKLYARGNNTEVRIYIFDRTLAKSKNCLSYIFLDRRTASLWS